MNSEVTRALRRAAYLGGEEGKVGCAKTRVLTTDTRDRGSPAALSSSPPATSPQVPTVTKSRSGRPALSHLLDPCLPRRRRLAVGLAIAHAALDRPERAV